ncbi:VWA domain-containing protein [Clostridium sp. 1001270J_160509_D11]|uniref:VWA domain-containing protein n=1 Tax=Clostridium sp. 1001270J_160509_D11 TaxID=2787103 RepID=UPI0018AB35D0|nr:VWA domain-containing protein [Clostridium sp. 1001270J_160509_D11]
MDKIFKRTVSILVALVMTIVMIPANAFVSFADEGGNIKSGKVTANAAENLTAEGEITEAKYQKVNSIDTQSDYLIVYENGGTSVALNNKGNSSDNGTSVTITDAKDGYYNITNVDSSMLWSFNKTVTSNNTTSEVKITNKASNQNLSFSSRDIDIGSSDNTLYVANRDDKFSIYNKVDYYIDYSYYYLNYNSKFMASRNGQQPPSAGNLTIYKQISQQTKKVTYTLTKPTKLTYRVGQSQNLNGGKITVKDESGNLLKEVDLSDEDVQITGFTSEAAGTPEIKVTYEGKTFNYYITVTNSTVTPVDPSIDDDAQYPNQGSVKVNKQVTEATKENFENTGLARLELGVKGVPTKKGVDAVLVFDRSASMNKTVSNGKTRTQVAKEASIKFIEKVLEDNADGSFSNNRIAIVTFNANATRLVALSDNEAELIKAIEGLSNTVSSGDTNYDAGVIEASNILNSARNQSGYNREQAVLFFSDGAPQNGYNDVNKPTNSDGYNHDATYNELKSAGAFLNKHKYSTQVKNLPATMYTVGFGLADYSGFTKSQMEEILRDYMATSSETFYSVQSAGELTDAFEKIGTAIKKAGTNAVVTDKMGPEFNLQMGKQYPSGVKNAAFPEDFDTTIKVSSYKVDSEGNRTGNPTNIETVTFSNDGKTATSDKLPDKSNIIENNKIKAKNFTYDLSTETFTWDIGDITQDEIVLSYPIYLENSMEGTRGAGNYDTNESAILNYTNINDKPWHKDFEVPSLPWKSANVKIEYYLVNENGQPINSAGTVVPWEYRVTLSNETRPLAKGSNLNIKATDNIPKGYVLHNKDAFYKIDKVGTENVVRTYSENDKSTQVTGTSPYTTSSVAFGVMTTTDLTPDTIVLDYGKPVTFNVLDNDGLKDITLNGVVEQEGTALGVNLNSGVSTTPNNKFTNEATDDYGKLEKKNNNGDVTYTLSKYMDGIDKFYYEVTGKTTGQDGKEEDFYKYSSISVIPATSVYYEDNFSSGTTNKDKTTNGIVYNGKAWEKVTNGTTDGKEEQDAEQGINTTYGQDSSYANDTTFSYGSAHVVTAEKGTPASAKFTFKGTGFEIIGRTDNNTGMMTVKVYDLKSNTLVRNIPCNTVYEEQDGVLYQIPVISVDGLSYGQYKVIITVTGTTDQDGMNHSSTVYIDGVRIFNPIDPNGTDATEANNKYKEDNEANQVVYEIRNLLLDKNSLTGGTDANGIVYVDTEGNITNPTTYKDLGPNNEVYLKKGNSIGFKLRSSQPAAIKIGLKTPNGEAGEVTVGSSKDSSGDPIVLNTATSMYYDVTNKIVFDDNNEAYVVITNTGDNDAIVSLTKIKFTFESEPAISPQLVVNQNDAKYISNMTLSRNGVEVDDNNKDNTSDDKSNSDTTDKPNNDTTNNNTSVINKVVNFFKNLFKK